MSYLKTSIFLTIFFMTLTSFKQVEILATTESVDGDVKWSFTLYQIPEEASRKGVFHPKNKSNQQYYIRISGKSVSGSEGFLKVDGYLNSAEFENKVKLIIDDKKVSLNQFVCDNTEKLTKHRTYTLGFIANEIDQGAIKLFIPSSIDQRTLLEQHITYSTNKK